MPGSAAVLISVPNVSEGRDQAKLGVLAQAFAPVYWSSDADHHRAVFTLIGKPGELHRQVLDGVRTAIETIDLTRHAGVHPRVGAVDVAPIVYLSEDQRGAACAEALVLADEIGRLGVPVFLYGELGGGRTRAELRRPGGLDGLTPDFGPGELHPTAGATLVAARPPLVAFNVTIDADLDAAKAIARRLREELDVRALGLRLTDGIQVSTNIEDHTRVTAAEVVAAVREHARVTGAELVAPAPRAALANFPEDVPLRGPKPLEDHLLS
jgi:glutamate formiminotransferase / 5-formyltetrahydrofolate cyclo-ligase